MRVEYETVEGVKLPARRRYAASNWQGAVAKDAKWTKQLMTNIKFKNGFILASYQRLSRWRRECKMSAGARSGLLSATFCPGRAVASWTDERGADRPAKASIATNVALALAFAAVACATSSSSGPRTADDALGSSCVDSQGDVRISSPIVVEAEDVFDGGCKTYTPTWGDCSQREGQDPVFRVNGGTLKNVIVGDRGDGIHVFGDATITNVHWPDVCEDALTIKRRATVTISGITARNADDKVFQVNAPSTVVVRNAVIDTAGKVVRENGTQCYPIDWRIEDAAISNVKRAVFKSACDQSTFVVKNVTLTNVPEICDARGAFKRCAVE